MEIKSFEGFRDAKQKRKEVNDKLVELNKPVMTDEETRSWSEKKAEFDAMDAAIKAFEGYQERQAAMPQIEQRAAGMPITSELAQARSNQPLKLFSNFGEQLKAVRSAAMGMVDERLLRMNAESRAALGNQESVGDDGGFAVQTDFAGQMMESAISAGELLSRVDNYTVSANSNGAKVMAIDETDVTSTVFGGVQVYWAAEAASVTATKPKFREIDLQLKKLMGVAYATDELLQDTNFMSQLYMRAFTTAIQRTLEGTIVSGDGVGKPTGILQSGALVTVAKENAQTADTVVFQNIQKMWGRMLSRNRANAVWLMHPDVEEVLPFMKFDVGTGGVPVYLPPTGLSGDGYSTLYSRPIISIDHCSAIGDVGDIMLIDPSQYWLITKGGVQAATSIHVQFLTGEQCFRFVFRANGEPKQNSAITIKNSANIRSAFITLAAR